MISVGDNVNTKVDRSRRMDISRNHTATHLLHSALRQVLGSHVEQSGSLVDDERLRFDFTHFEAISKEDLKKVETIVNEKIMDSLNVETVETALDEARKMGAMALFGEKYGSVVRVVKAGDFSTELCGGTHVQSTASIGMFKIVSEGGVAAGVRRIEAVTGKGVLKYIEVLDNTLKDVASTLKSTVKDTVRRAETLMSEFKEKEKEIEELKSKMAANSVNDFVDSAREIKGIKVIASLADLDVEGLRDLGDRLRDKLGKSVVVLASAKDGKVNFIAMASKDAVLQGAHSGNIVREVAKVAGGGGGGKPESAQAGGKNPEKITEALNYAYNVIENMIK